MHYSVLKRCLDVVGAVVLLAAFLPLLAICALLVKTSGKPVIFRQLRVGKGGKVITVYKLDTMHRAPFELCLHNDDPRITPVGRWLRRLRLDELPQLINVIRGDMSLVGPRPLPVEIKEQVDQLPDYAPREIVRPGITGWAKIHCPNGQYLLDRETRAYDLEYVRQVSFRLDLLILLLTPLAVIRGCIQQDGAQAPPSEHKEALT
jgi:lipopolysaccharide/colanic/teichoic acid biosynthesis glycosyltransferase